MKASWSGYITAGSLVIPIRLYSATRSNAPRFVQLHGIDHSSVTRNLVCLVEGKEISFDEVVRAVEHNGSYIEINETDLKRTVRDDKSLLVHQFCEQQAIPSIYYEKPYYIVPARGGELGYTIMREGFERVKKVAVVTFTIYGKEHVGIILSMGGLLILQQLRYASEIVPKSELPTLPLRRPTPLQVDLVAQLMERYATSFYIEDYRDEQADHLAEVVERKAKGLGPKRVSRIAPHSTPEEKVTPILKSLVQSQTAPPALS